MPADLRYADWVAGADARLPLDAALVPFIEPGSVGELPVAPTLIQTLATTHQVRTTISHAGRVRTAVLAARPRATFEIEWAAIPKADRDALWSFILDSAEGTTRAFSLRVDGPDADPITAILTADPTEQEIDRGIYRLSAPAMEIFA